MRLGSGHDEAEERHAVGGGVECLDHPGAAFGADGYRVGERCGVHGRGGGHEGAGGPGRTALHVLEEVGVALLRHGRARAHQLVGQFQEGELGRGPQEQVGGQPAGRHAEDRRCRQEAKPRPHSPRPEA